MKTKLSLNLSQDTEEMTESIDYLLARGLRLARLTIYQLKSGQVSYYPNTGSIVIDGEGKKISGGLSALERLIETRSSLFEWSAKKDMMGKTTYNY